MLDTGGWALEAYGTGGWALRLGAGGQAQEARYWTIYSATTFLENCRKVVLEKWFFKLGFFFLVNHFSRTRKNVDLWYKLTFYLVNHSY